MILVLRVRRVRLGRRVLQVSKVPSVLLARLGLKVLKVRLARLALQALRVKMV